MFVSLDKLSRYPPAPSFSEPPPSGQRHTTQPHPQPAPPAVGSSTDTQHRTEYLYKKGDRVVVFTKKEVPIHGVVKWVGRHSFTVDKKQYSSKVVGIETVSVIFQYCHAQ